MKTQKQIASQIIKLSAGICKTDILLNRAKSKNLSTVALYATMKEQNDKLKHYCSQITEAGFNGDDRIAEVLCCDWEEFKNAYSI